MTRKPKRPTSSECRNAILYLRMSDKSQVENGNGLQSQETTCREYADRKGYDVVAVFSDDLTGKTANRDGLKELLSFLKKQKAGTRVIIDDLNRLARSVRTILRFAMSSRRRAASWKRPSACSPPIPKTIFSK